MVWSTTITRLWILPPAAGLFVNLEEHRRAVSRVYPDGFVKPSMPRAGF